MAKVSLRIYNREIESIIEHGQGLDEAVAHCHHILKTFPKHLETYRLLGKAYLESKRYDAAVDIFQRVLVSAPDDFVSHVGMSIITDDKGKLDDAIWHMERAFEVQPSNAAIQGELQRLFGRRDGVEPPKIRLTRGALAHMYVQGELYTQAISEIRAVLSNDAGRNDMQVLLAKAYFKNGQKTEATEICTQLLKRFPYGLDANRIMTEILPGTQRADATQTYRRRVNELDPYAAFVQESVFRADEVADAVVSVERLEYKGETVEMGATAGIGLESDSTAIGAQPDWLKAAASEPGPKPAPVSKPKEEIPDFLRQAGWGETTGTFKEGPSTSEAGPESDAVQADLPAWVKAMAPPGEPPSQPSPSQPIAAPTEETPDWLRNLGGNQPMMPEPAAENPGWLRNFEEPAPPSEPMIPPAAPSSNADWLRNLGGEQSAIEQPASTDVPGWLKGLGEESAQPIESGQPPMMETPAQTFTEELPAAKPAGDLGGLGTSAKEQDDAMAWLESLAAKHGAKSEELVTDPNARTGITPEWVDKAKEIGEPPVVGAPAPTSAPEAAEPEDETGIWLRNLKEGQADFMEESAESEKEETPILGAQQTPDWLSGLGTAQAQPAESQDVPDWLRGTSTPQPPPAFESSEEVSAIPASAADLPDWLAGLDKEEAEKKQIPSDEELPSWLQNEAGPESTERTQPADWRPVEEQPVMEEPSGQEEFAFEEPAPQLKAGPRPEKKVPPMPTRPKPMPKVGESSLANAQSELGRGNIAASLEIYGRLIRKGKTLEEIIRDLREALYRYPVEVPIWQALGDAYMRANRLQEALDAYTKAEELLR